MSLPLFSLWLIIGMLPLLWLAALPSVWVVAGLAGGVLGLALVGGWRWRGGGCLAVAVLGFCWAVLAGQQALWPLGQLGERVAVVRLTQTDGGRHHQGRIVALDGRRLWWSVPVSLSSGRLEGAVCAGQRWRVRVQLRGQQASLNVGGFDGQRYGLAQGQVLTGRVVQAEPVARGCSVRAGFLQRVREGVGDRPRGAVILALGFGERGGVADEVKQLLRDTATAHLMAISGLHIGFALLLGAGLARVFQGLLPGRYIGWRLPLLVGLAVAGLYTWVSGANPPAQRSLVAALVWGAVRLRGRQWHGWQVWLCCLAAVLVVSPLSLLSDSFWLSAFAVAGLIFWYQWVPLPPGFWRLRWCWRYPLGLLHLQAGVMLLLLPLQVLIFHGVSLGSVVANLLAVPLVSLVALPLILAGMLASLLPFAGAAAPFWFLADQVLGGVFAVLGWLPAGWVGLDERWWWLTLLPWFGLVYWRMRGYLLSPASFSVLVVLLGYPFWRVADKDGWQAHVLDVGQGQLVVIARHDKAWIYDTGTAWPGGDTVQQTLIPWLQWQHLTPQGVVLSDADFAKRGGLRTLMRRWPGLPLVSLDGLGGGQRCVRGQHWRWQGLEFEVHWPPEGRVADDGESCVVTVSDGRNRLLLTGGLDQRGERDLLRYYWRQLRADVMLVPRYGSNRASSDLLLSRVGGRVALASFSRVGVRQSSLDKVKRRYAQQGYLWYDTAHSGQINVQFSRNGWQVQTLRGELRPRWYHNDWGR